MSAELMTFLPTNSDLQESDKQDLILARNVLEIGAQHAIAVKVSTHIYVALCTQIIFMPHTVLYVEKMPKSNFISNSALIGYICEKFYAALCT